MFMKKIIVIILVILVGCSSTPENNQATAKGNINIFQAWTNMDNEGTELGNISKHDLVFSDTWIFDIGFLSDNLLETRLDDGELTHAFERKETLKALNPDILILCELYYREGIPGEHLPYDSELWIRDDGEIAPAWGEDINADGHVSIDEIETGLIDFTKSEMIQAVASRAETLYNSGLFDGIMLDWWSEEATTGNMDWTFTYLSKEEELEGRVKLLQEIRSKVGEDFLILVNSNAQTLPITGQYVNGLYMECYKENYDQGYLEEEVHDIEHTLLWAEETLRSPTINCLEGWRIVSDLSQSYNKAIRERESEENLKWMRLFTTMSLTLSDGYVLFADDNQLPFDDHGHNYYDFWQLDIGHPLDDYQKLKDHVYIRYYENAIIVYNGSSALFNYKADEFLLDSVTEERKTSFEIASFDGKILMRANDE